ncbi:uncharacterized protein LOC126662140 [Mercurialis annua]|uniref:uncharacterized protein LOC126662140 n=1 Tax=Mercurialis annua TaxID=3986 RepID=UPI00215EB0EB|nr:uncharacterized protein LOC126662140 [Mercurialis annua]
MVDGKMCHPSDFPAWKHLSELYTEFAEEVRNIRLGLCTDGFQPFGAFGQNYSSWPTFDVHRRQNFQMKAALMWTINDFPAYSMLSGWSTSGRLACRHCMENTEAFTLKGSRKQSWFDCDKKFLPRGHMYRRNTTDFRKGKSLNKEFGQPKTGEELLAEVDRLGFMKAYEIGAEINNAAKSTDYGDVCDMDGKKALLEWIKLIKFPDGYASNLSRCVDTIGLKMHGMKSHDCHIFMQRLLPIAFRELLPKEVWEPLTELSIFFRELTSTSLTEKDLDRMRLEIPKILCKLERIFPPSFFDSMEHLPVHLPYAATMAGPFQYRWMYPFEDILRKLKKKVGNKGRVEGSISSGYLNEETAIFAAYFFSEGDPMMPERLQRNEVCDIEVDDDVDQTICFQAAWGIRFSRASCVEETPKSAPYKLKQSSRVTLPTGSNNILAKGHLRSVRTFKGYRVNGYKFQTQAFGEEQLTMNSGVCVKGTQYVDSENEFYGILTDIIELEYPALPMKTTVLFKCEWFDPVHNSGTISNKKYNMVDINNRKRYNKYEPFILAEQADQFHYLPYPNKRRDKLNWWAVCRIKARSELDMPKGIISAFQDEIEENPLVVATDENTTCLADQNGEADEDALFVPPEEETELDEFIASSSDEDESEEL